ncbi:MAG: Uma2 family endonuclease [Gemmataceae bacterium]|nr:Uma2 family endonuclease [Gemmataceae bacterium]
MNRAIRYQRSSERTTKAPALPHLESGDRLDQKTFHERYEAMPKHFRAKLIGGIVYVSSPLKIPHGRGQNCVNRWLYTYEDHTPGVEVFANTTNMMGPDTETQPDAQMNLMAGLSEQIRETDDQCFEGAAELIVEVAWSTESLDLHAQKDAYEHAGVQEYVVIALRMKHVFWFRLQRGKFKELKPDDDGILRSEVFPGLWLDPDAMLRFDTKRLLKVLRQGLASPEHAAFAAKLAKKARRNGG